MCAYVVHKRDRDSGFRARENRNRDKRVESRDILDR